MFAADFLLVWTIIAVIMTWIDAVENVNNIQYGREALLALRHTMNSPPPTSSSTRLDLLKEVLINRNAVQHYSSKHHGRRRGRRGGIRARIRRRGIRTPLPTVMFGNVQSIRNKIDELSANCKFIRDYRESAIVAVTESWLEDKDLDETVNIDGFSLIRSDRRNTVKVQGGGIAVYINENWCKQVTVKYSFCSDDLEYQVLSCRPFYLPREFGSVIIINVYVPPTAKDKEVREQLLKCIDKYEKENPESVKIILGDFNQFELDEYIPNYDQYVKCTTRGENTLDKMYCNVKDSYRVIKKPPLGKADHNMLYCVPKYKQLLKREKCTKINVRDWDEDHEIRLQGCFDCTDWSVLRGDPSDVDGNVDVFSSYIEFCVGMIVPAREVTSYPNNKPWITKDVKILINEKKRFINAGDRVQLKALQNQVDAKILEEKRVYKDKVENLFRSNRAKEAWKGLKVLCSSKPKSSTVDPEDIESYVNDLNAFYARFDIHNFKEECENLIKVAKERNNARIIITYEDVIQSMRRVKIGKSSGPDNISARVLRLCLEQFARPIVVLFQDSLDHGRVPMLWKLSEIIPVPKIRFPKELNDLRPVTLTSIIMKCLEDIVKKYLGLDVDHIRDPLQFAYCKGKSVQDVGLTLVHNIAEHLENPNPQVRVLFIDFSSAFNTIQVHILLNKLLDMNVNSNLIIWIYSYLTGRPQYTKLKGVKSDVIFTNTGAPQGCVLSPLLFTLYTNDCCGSYDNCSVFKYADDTVIVGKICNDDSSSYLSQVEDFVNWCGSNYLNLNVKKTKEMIIDYRVSNKYVPDQIKIGTDYIDRVCDYKYLGIVIDDKLRGSVNNQRVYKKCNQGLHFLRVLRTLRVDNSILTLFYKSVVESVLCFSITIWYGRLTKKDKGKLKKIVKIASKLGAQCTSLEELYNKFVIKQVDKIVNDVNHPLHDRYVFLRSGRRFSLPAGRRDRFRDSFVPKSIKLYNHLSSR